MAAWSSGRASVKEVNAALFARARPGSKPPPKERHESRRSGAGELGEAHSSDKLFAPASPSHQTPLSSPVGGGHAIHYSTPLHF